MNREVTFVLVSTDSTGDYYRGNTYVHQGEYFPGLGRKAEAKTYKSRKVAERVLQNLNNRVEMNFEIVDLEASHETET